MNPGLNQLLEGSLKGCKSVLDLGCGYESPVKDVFNAFSVGVEVQKNYVKKAVSDSTHTIIIKSGVLELLPMIKDKSFDAVVAIDFIEHLSKKQGMLLRKHMERIAKKKVVIFTPNGKVTAGKPPTDFDDHHSGWTIKDFDKYKITGVNGFKALRKDDSQPVIKPVLLGNLVSEATQFFVRYYPQSAFHLYAEKKV